MSQEKEVLQGIVTLGLTVKTADGVLPVGTKVKISDDNEVEAVDANYDGPVGYILVANKEAGGKCTVATRGMRVADVVSGAAFSHGALLMPDSAGKMIPAKGVQATATIVIVDYSAFDGAEVFVVNGVTLAHTTDFTVGTSDAVTALSLCNAINAKVPGVVAKVAADTITLYAAMPGTYGNAIALSTDAIADEATVSGATFSGGKDFFPTGMALEDATAADQTRSMLWF